MYDIIIVGAGPAGMTAALYARRAQKSVLIIEKENFGGQITYSPKVENYPGYLSMSGNEFAEKLLEQITEHGVDIELEEVTSVSRNNDVFIITTDRGSHEGLSVIIAAGSKHRKLGIDREDELVGNGVSYCAVCDGAFYKDKTVAVIGGGNTALQDAMLLKDQCKKVYIFQNLPFLTGEKTLTDKLMTAENVEIIYNATVDSLIGESELTGIVTVDAQTGEKTSTQLDGIFIAIGQQPENKPFDAVTSIDHFGYIEANESCTVADGVFVAGDCRTKIVRQVTTAVGDGAVAAVAACRYVDGKK